MSIGDDKVDWSRAPKLARSSLEGLDIPEMRLYGRSEDIALR